MKRREFISLLSGAALAWPLPLGAQQVVRRPRVGVLIFSNPQTDPNTEAFRRGMHDLGYVDGQNIAIEYRYAEGKPERFPELAAELVRLKPDVVFVLGGDAAPFVSKATQTIPIIYSMSADPVKLGLAASFARPGGNATGVTFLSDELAAKRLEILKEAAPRISRVGFLWNPDHADNELDGAKRAAAAHGVQLHLMETRGAGDLDGAFERRHTGRRRCDLCGLVAAYGGERSTHRRLRHQEPPAAGWRLGCMGAGGWADLLRPERRRDGPESAPSTSTASRRSWVQGRPFGDGARFEDRSPTGFQEATP